MIPSPFFHSIGRSPADCIRLVRKRLPSYWPRPFGFNFNGDLRKISAVLFLLGADTDGTVHLILNKRSQHVRQAGDLCCPGGGISPAMDFFISRWLDLPATPLARWPHRKWWRRNRSADYPKLSLLLATALREGVEEMRLNPFGLTFLGPLPVQHLILFQKAIYPMVAWVNRQRRFFPNWEVDEIIRIPLADLLRPENYGRICMSFSDKTAAAANLPQREHPCYVHRHRDRDEVLWGATYRITLNFLSTILDFTPPPADSLPRIHRRVGRRYLEGDPSSRH